MTALESSRKSSMEVSMMKNNSLVVAVFSLCVMTVLMMSGCGSESSSSSTSPTTVIDVTGAWNLALESYPPMTLNLTQDANGNITGTVRVDSAKTITVTGSTNTPLDTLQSVKGTNTSNNIRLDIWLCPDSNVPFFQALGEAEASDSSLLCSMSGDEVFSTLMQGTFTRRAKMEDRPVGNKTGNWCATPIH
jgi:hypothetical protein